MKKIATLHFGEIEVEDEHIVHFDDGILGFENLKDYVLIVDDETVPFKWLVSLDSPDIGFPLLSPWLVEIEYNPGNDYNFDIEAFFVVVTLEDEDGKMTANLKAPIIINIQDKTGRQIILSTDKYPTNQVIGGNSQPKIPE